MKLPVVQEFARKRQEIREQIEIAKDTERLDVEQPERFAQLLGRFNELPNIEKSDDGTKQVEVLIPATNPVSSDALRLVLSSVTYLVGPQAGETFAVNASWYDSESRGSSRPMILESATSQASYQEFAAVEASMVVAEEYSVQPAEPATV